MISRKIFLKVHLWLGLVIGILFFIIAFSGAIYSWEPEISRIIYKQKVQKQDRPFVSVSKLNSVVKNEFPEGDFRTAMISDSTSTAVVLLYGQGTYYNSFHDPYSGEMIHLQDMNKGWLNILKKIHRNLWLGEIGKEIVHWVTLCFLIMMVTGIVLWWPRNKNGRKRRFSIRWQAIPKKLNYDLHNVLGFYVTWIVIFSVITGLFWGFEFIPSALKQMTGEHKMQYDIPKSNPEITVKNDQETFDLLDQLLVEVKTRYPERFVRISNPHQDDEPIRVAIIDPVRRLHKTSHLYFDRYTGKRIEGHFENGMQQDASLYHTLHMLVYDIHLGNIWGFPSRLFMFFSAVVASSLPVTGFIIWWGKNKKRKK